LLHHVLDFLFFVLTFTAQWHMGARLFRAVRRRSSPALARLTAVALIVAGSLLAAGYLLGFTEIRSALPLRASEVGMFSGLAQLWLLTTSIGYALHLLIRRLTRRIPFEPSRRRLLNSASGALLASPFLVVGYGSFIERTSFRVREVDIPIPGLHPDLDGLRLLQLTDIHLSPFLSVRELQRVIHTANELKAHLTLVTGDLISSPGDPLDDCLRLLSTVRTDAGILGCMGNHEYFSGAEKYAAEQGARLGIGFLRSRNRTLHFGRAPLNVAGVDYQRMSVTHTGYLRGADRMIVPGALNVLLSHNPDVFPIAAAQGYDLTVSGHTHGGQVNIEILTQEINPARFITPYVYGAYEWTGDGRRGAAYVSRGIGTIGIPARVGAPPEISVLRLRKA
jgi:predicted MPP superfamily phosphohydrolase